ncbi:MAG: GGDEF domain-containing protein, partial [Chloroflexota bacterium]|nr:GGDEF domain-containing protein [Chloroflexota bacterium]
RPLALAMIDVDNFKTVNDTLGHTVGDQVLQAIASILVGAARTSDIVARFAGDEFVMIFPAVDEQVAGAVAERVVASVQRINAQLGLGREASIGLSIGVAFTESCKRNVAQLIAIADAAMYDAKEAGKSRVMAVNADTLTTRSYWGAEPANAASSHGDRNRRGQATRSTG